MSKAFSTDADDHKFAIRVRCNHAKVARGLQAIRSMEITLRVCAGSLIMPHSPYPVLRLWQAF
jgi:hypothetical protein